MVPTYKSQFHCMMFVWFAFCRCSHSWYIKRFGCGQWWKRHHHDEISDSLCVCVLSARENTESSMGALKVCRQNHTDETSFPYGNIYIARNSLYLAGFELNNSYWWQPRHTLMSIIMHSEYINSFFKIQCRIYIMLFSARKSLKCLIIRPKEKDIGFLVLISCLTSVFPMLLMCYNVMMCGSSCAVFFCFFSGVWDIKPISSVPLFSQLFSILQTSVTY